MARPTTDQPVLAQSNGIRWWLQVSNQGVLQVASKTDAPLTPVRRLRLVDPTNAVAFQLGISDDAVPVPTLTQLRDSSLGNHQDLPIYSPNGREWTLQVTQIGEITVAPLATSWPMIPVGGLPTYTPSQPYQFPPSTIVDSQGIPWRLLVDDGGIWSVSQSYDPNQSVMNALMWTQDDTLPFQVTVDQNGLLTVIDSPLGVNTPKNYELVLCAPGGTFYTLVGDNVAGDIILSITDTLQQAIWNRDEWSLVISQHGNYLYIADDRFPPPIPAMPRRWGQRRRTPRRHA